MIKTLDAIEGDFQKFIAADEGGGKSQAPRPPPALPTVKNMRISTLSARASGEVELGVVYASVEGVNEESCEECLRAPEEKAHALGATALIGMQPVQSQFQ
jgi:hypothetical protein